MAEYNAKLGSQTTSHVEILQSLGNFPYLQQNFEGPETAGVADVLVLAIGDALKMVAGKIERYQDGDTEDIFAVAAESYDSTVLNTTGAPAGHIDTYAFGCLKKDSIFKLDGPGTGRELLSSTDLIKAKKMGLYLL